MGWEMRDRDFKILIIIISVWRMAIVLTADANPQICLNMMTHKSS